MGEREKVVRFELIVEMKEKKKRSKEKQQEWNWEAEEGKVGRQQGLTWHWSHRWKQQDPRHQQENPDPGSCFCHPLIHGEGFFSLVFVLSRFLFSACCLLVCLCVSLSLFTLVSFISFFSFSDISGICFYAFSFFHLCFIVFLLPVFAFQVVVYLSVGLFVCLFTFVPGISFFSLCVVFFRNSFVDLCV